MPALFTYLTAVERLAAHVNSLPPEFTKALGEDLEYARFGVALPELPWFGGWSMGLDAWLARGLPPHFARLLMTKAPVAFGLKAAELVSNGALVGVEAGLAFLAGYFTHVCVARAVEPLLQSLVVTHQKPGESAAAARNRIEWSQSLLLMQDLHGSPLVGTPAVRGKLQVRKVSSLRGISRGFYELVRVSSQEAFGEAPTKAEVDGWMRGLYVFSLALGSPVGRLKAIPGQLSSRELYRGPGVDFFALVDEGLDRVREVLGVLGGMIRRNSFSSRARARLLELLPEGSPAEVMKTQAA